MMNKKLKIEKWVRANIRELKPYHSARDDFKDGLLLDANENSFGAPAEELEGLNRYPSPQQVALRKKVAEFRGVEVEKVFAGAGSDEAIHLLFQIFCRPGKDRIITLPPTYGMYRVSANIHDVAVDEVALDENYQPKVHQIVQRAGQCTKLLFLCSPNNPTGNLLERSKVVKLIEKFEGIVVIDEAYIDFSGQQSFVSLLLNHPNLVVLQTMSKSFGLAGIRLGMAFASEKIISYFMKVKAPYNINKLTSDAAMTAFEHKNTITQKINAIIKERAWLQQKLKQLEAVTRIYDSDANFLLVKMEGAKKIYQKLAAKNIIVRYRGNQPGCEHCLRITVGTRAENNQLINAIKWITHETLD